MTTVAAAQAVVARFGLPVAVPAISAPLDADEWIELFGWLGDQRLVGLAAAAATAGSLPVTADQRSWLNDAHTQAMVGVLLLERALLDLADRLESHHIGYAVLKGPTVAYTAYPDPSMRSYCDIDLIVRGTDIDRTVALLVGDGCRRHYPQMRNGFDRRFGKSVTLIRPDGIEIDLHRTFVSGVFGLTVDLEAVFEARDSLGIAGRPVPVLGVEERVLAACYNAAVGDPRPRLMTLRDIAQMVLVAPLDEDRVLALARTWRSEPVLARAVSLTWDQLGIDTSCDLSEWSSSFRPTASETRAIAGYTSSRSAASQILSTLPAIPGTRAKAAFLSAVLLPDRQYLDRKGGAPRRYVRWWHKGVRSLRKAVSGA